MAPPAVAEDRSLAAGFEPDTILPIQLLDAGRSGAGAQPEKRLMLAVLEEAVATYQRTATAGARLAARDFADVERWFASDEVAWPYSFVNICHVLGFDPGALRGGLARWLTGRRRYAASNGVARVRFAFRRISGSRTRPVVPRRWRTA